MVKVKNDLTGKIFGKLTVISQGDDYVSNSGRHYSRWICRCSCGNEKDVLVSGYHLTSGHTSSCGYVRADLQKEIHTIHGNTDHYGKKSKLYNSWRGMRERCNNKKHQVYEYYGGRGIRACDEWDKFEEFMIWAVNNGYKEGLTIDRIDVNADYCQSNCRWASNVEQCNNKRNNRLLYCNGETHSISEWSRISGVKSTTIRNRINNLGWSVEDAIFLPSTKRFDKNIQYSNERTDLY